MGSLKDFSGSDLGAIGIALDTANVAAASVDYVIMGQVLTAGAGQMPARQAAVAAGIGWDVPALTVNKMCLSGLDAIALADQLIRAGEFEDGDAAVLVASPSSTTWPTTACTTCSPTSRWAPSPNSATPSTSSLAPSRTSSLRRPELVPLAAHLLAMNNPLTGLTWLHPRKGRDRTPAHLLAELGRGEIELTHTAFHALQPCGPRRTCGNC